MALRYIDSMGDHYTAGQIDSKWTSSFSPIRDVGLHGYGMRGNLHKGMLFGSTTIILEAFIKHLSGGASLFALGDTNGTPQISCSRNGDGGIEVDRYGSNPAVDRIFQSAPDLIRVGGWYHFAWKVLVHPTAGSVEVRLNGGTICNITGIQTTTSLGAGFWSGAVGSFNLGSNANATIFDDLVVMDDVDDGIDDSRLPGGGGYDKFIGPVVIKVKRPNAAGLLAEWTGVPTGPNWENVNDLVSDGDATHNVATVAEVGKSDLFAMENLFPTEDILAVQSLVLSRKTDDGIAAVAKLVRDSGTTTQGATVYQPNSYAYMHVTEPTLPDGSLWTKAKWDAIQYGYKRIV